jgi:hypothetical protein
MTQHPEREHRNLTSNWWISKLVSMIALCYLIASLFFSFGSNTDKVNSLKNEHIILFAIILLFNSNLIEKIEVFSLGNLSAKFASKDLVDKLGDRVDTLLLGIILDSYEYITIQAIAGRHSDDSYNINPKGESQLERLINRGLIKIKGDNSFLKHHGKTIQLREHFEIEPNGIKYLNLVGEAKS